MPPAPAAQEVFYHCDQLIKSMYAVFLPRWRSEHRRVLALRAEDYYASPRGVLASALRFIGAQPPAEQTVWDELLRGPPRVHGTRPAGGVPPMAPATKAMLVQFYRPLLRELAEQLRGESDAAEWRAWAERWD